MENKNKVNIKLTLIMVALLAFILVIVFMVFNEAKDESNLKGTSTKVAKVNKTSTKIEKAKLNADAPSNINAPAIEPIPVSTETPIEKGIKARHASITLKDELYSDEFVLHKEEVVSIVPTPIRPKQKFVKWVQQFSGSVAGAILANGDKLYFATYDYQTFILQAESGDVLFHTKTISQPVNSTREYKGLFLVPQRNGQVTAYSMIDGKEKWNHRSAVDKPTTEIDLSISGIIVYGNKFYVSKHWGNLYIVNADTGVLDQDVGVTYESRINLPAIKTDDGILFSNVAGELHCFKDDGKENWKYTLPKGYPLSMHLIKGTLFMATTEKELIALNLKDRSIKWSKELAGYAFDSITSGTGVLYIQAKDIYAMEPETGKINWQIKAKSEEGFCRGAPVYNQESLFAVEQSGRLISANLIRGEVLKDINFHEIVRSPLTNTEGILFLSTISKRVYGIDILALSK